MTTILWTLLCYLYRTVKLYILYVVGAAHILMHSMLNYLGGDYAALPLRSNYVIIDSAIILFLYKVNLYAT